MTRTRARRLTAGVLTALTLLVTAVGLQASPAAAAPPAVSLSLPDEIAVDTGFYDVPVLVTNTSGTSYPAARASLNLKGPQFLGVDDIFVEVENAAFPGTYYNLGLTKIADGEFVVAAAGTDFPLPNNGSFTLNLRIATGPGAPSGPLTLTVVVRRVVSEVPDIVLASGSDTTSLLAPSVTVGTTTPIPALGSGDIPITVENPTGTEYFDVEGRFSLVGPADLTPDDVQIQFNSGAGFVNATPITQPVATKIEVEVPLPDDTLPTGASSYTVRVIRKATSSPGTIRTEFQVQTRVGDAGLGFGADEVQFASPVGLAFPLPSTLVAGAAPAPVATTLTNGTGVAYDDVAVALEITGPLGLVPADLAIDYQKPGSAVRTVLALSPSAGKILGRVPLADSVDLGPSSVATYGFRIRALPGIPDGALSVTARLVLGSGNDTLAAVTRTTTVGAKPGLVVNAPDTAPRGGAAQAASVTLTNSTGATFDPARIDLRFDGPAGFGPEDITVELDNPSTPAVDFGAVALTTPAGGGVVARLPAPTGAAFGAGSTSYSLRIGLLASAPLGALQLTGSLIATNAGGSFVTAEPLATGVDSLTVVAVAGTTSTALVASPVPGRATQSQTLTATVTRSDPGAPSPAGGTVTFRDGTAVLGTATVGGFGNAVLVLPNGLTTGDRKLTATFGGLGILQASTSPVVTLLVTPPTLIGRYVDAVYRKILLRPAEPEGLVYWENRLNTGLSRRAYADLLFKLTEPLTRLCDKIYLEQVGRKATAAERTSCVTRLKNKEKIPTIGSEVVGSAEFFTQAGGTNAGFVALAHTRILRRSAFPPETTFWLNQLASGVSRRTVALRMLNSDERYGLVVDDAYQLMLNRFSDAPGRQFWVDKMKAGVPETNLLAQLLGSPEYLATVP